jgi:hypothetical protein
MVEQSRAEMEVKAAVTIAQQNPRDPEAARRRMQFACRQPALALKAFYSFPRGREIVSGASIQLATELALNYGNIQYSVVELSRDSGAGQSEILVYAWDLEANSRSAQIFIAPHLRYTSRNAQKLTDLRDVYENNSNQGARRLREAIFKVLPAWYVGEATELCRETIGKHIAELVATYEKVGVSLEQLEAKVECRRSEWTGKHATELASLYTSVSCGEITRDDAFPPIGGAAATGRVTAEELTGGAPANAPGGPQ